ncbi:ubiquitin carboxyl-terminal hydrolase [Aspergillus thermomutatus]|uniref:USP domain-containing protein n=1 Tax=Aspergillus thermomutatus TaxID=41047 RepID=A0A397GXF0_ASPTH|nr:uncharacterized protein CDV56_107172 [Aspergillus thermomutatus]RHZ55662.1 hypothetical protein CDV56_107172 [Aspergillus thermomutatus]
MANQPTSPSGSLPQQGAVSSAWNHVSLKPSLPTRGFDNHKGQNLCYRNAALTLILHTPQFLSWCEKYRAQAPSGSVPDVVRKFYDMIKAYWQCPNGHQLAMETLWRELQNRKHRNHRWQTTLGQQHDTLEMMDSIISLLESQTGSNHDLMDLMTVDLSQYRVCKTCKQKDSSPGDRVRFLYADLPGSKKATPIEDAIISGMKSETLSNCKTCANNQIPHEIQRQILLPSEILVVQVNRYKKSGKLKDEIEVQDELVIPDSLLDDGLKGQGKICYELYAVIFHIGDVSTSGHYTAAVKGPSGQWVMTNDRRVAFTQTLDQSMSSPDGGKENAYILAYRRLESQGNSADSNTGSSAAASSSSPKASSSGKGSAKGGVQMKGTIELEGRPIQWTIDQQLVLDPGKGALVALGPRARTQRATLQLTFTSEDTGEILEGQVTMSLKPRIVQKPKGAPSKTTDTKDSNAGTKKATDTVPESQDLNDGIDHPTIRPQRHTSTSHSSFSSLPEAQLSQVKPVMLTLHCFFPNELLLALDILDRGLVRRFTRDDHVGQASACSQPEETDPSNTGRSQEDMFYVISTSAAVLTSPSRAPRTRIEQKGYEVRLHAWNCTCPTFTLNAFRDPGPDHSSQYDGEDEDEAWAEQSTVGDLACRYVFGGSLTRGASRLAPPVCKHLLACLLMVRCPGIFSSGSPDRSGRVVLTCDELAACCAGWGG